MFRRQRSACPSLPSSVSSTPNFAASAAHRPLWATIHPSTSSPASLTALKNPGDSYEHRNELLPDESFELIFDS
jgi:hypothetical protein